MNEQRLELAHVVLILIGFGFFIAGIANRLNGALGVGIAIIGANLRALARERA